MTIETKHSTSFDPEIQRKNFPILQQEIHGKPLIYLDNGATTQKPSAVLEAMDHYYRKDNSNVHRGIHTLSNRATESFEQVRDTVANFLNAPSREEIVFTKGTTEAINLVARTWAEQNLNEGDVILLTEMEHHSNLVPWQLLAQRKGLEIRYVPVTDDEGILTTEQVDKMLTPEVKLFAFTHISNTLGVVNPAREFCALARKKGVVTLVDGAQSAGHMPIDLQDMQPDFFVFSGHKTAGPTGVGVLYGRFELLEQMPPFHGGGEMIDRVSFDRVTFKKPPHKFEAGTPNIAEVVGLGASLKYLSNIGMDRIFAHDHELAAYADEHLRSLPGIRVLGPRQNRAGLVSFHFDKVHAHDLVTFADMDGIALRGGHHCTQPLMEKLGLHSTARASFYLYNTKQEVDRLLENLNKTLSFFTS
ncbi:MAG: cysteine desulfurase [Opitutales bacterium]|nr:cysteine desulfurase [Opitutales bacterium]MCH8540404.1 cysteine desulfurase [Opitutales bacterium]